MESAYLTFGRFRWFLAEFGMGSGQIREKFGTGYVSFSDFSDGFWMNSEQHRDEFGIGFKTSTNFKTLKIFSVLNLERVALLNVKTC